MSDTTRTHLPIDYEEYAPTYAWSRFAVPWVLDPLSSLVSEAPGRALEIGCGTGNYVRALSDLAEESTFFGVDLTFDMLREANSFGARVHWTCGDASTAMPFLDQTFHVAFAVDVIHHIEDISCFFVETHRILKPGGKLLIFTDSEQTLRRRSLTRFFPEILSKELARYPKIIQLHVEAERAGLVLVGQEQASGYIPLDETFARALAAKCSSAMRLITAAEHAAGMSRVEAARAEGEQWFSCYDVLQYARPA